MTPARKAALQWFHENPAGSSNRPGAPSAHMISAMLKAGEIEHHGGRRYSLTDLGRRRLHGDDV